jgi:hypothetical protein
MFNRKRKRFSSAPQSQWRTDGSERNDIDIFLNVEPQGDGQSAFSIPAFEAELIHGPHAKQAARSLEIVPGTDAAGLAAGVTWNVGDGLIRWGGGVDSVLFNKNTGDTSSFQAISDETEDGWLQDENTSEPVWVDRYVLSQSSCLHHTRPSCIPWCGANLLG